MTPVPLPVPLNDLRRHNEPLTAALKEAGNRVIDSGWYSLGGEVAAFERDFAAYCGENDRTEA